jgi:hypothetical protein
MCAVNLQAPGGPSHVLTRPTVAHYTLQPAGLAQLGATCRPLRQACTADAYWRRHYADTFRRPVARGVFDDRMTLFQLVCCAQEQAAGTMPD